MLQNTLLCFLDFLCWHELGNQQDDLMANEKSRTPWWYDMKGCESRNWDIFQLLLQTLHFVICGQSLQTVQTVPMIFILYLLTKLRQTNQWENNKVSKKSIFYEKWLYLSLSIFWNPLVFIVRFLNYVKNIQIKAKKWLFIRHCWCLEVLRVSLYVVNKKEKWQIISFCDSPQIRVRWKSDIINQHHFC